MAGDVSFDVVSDFDEQELRNALDQVRREVGQRFDFKGVTVELEQSPFLSIVSRERVRQVLKLMTRSPDERIVEPVARDLRHDLVQLLDDDRRGTNCCPRCGGG